MMTQHGGGDRQVSGPGLEGAEAFARNFAHGEVGAGSPGAAAAPWSTSGRRCRPHHRAPHRRHPAAGVRPPRAPPPSGQPPTQRASWTSRPRSPSTGPSSGRRARARSRSAGCWATGPACPTNGSIQLADCRPGTPWSRRWPPWSRCGAGTARGYTPSPTGTGGWSAGSVAEPRAFSPAGGRSARPGVLGRAAPSRSPRRPAHQCGLGPVEEGRQNEGLSDLVSQIERYLGPGSMLALAWRQQHAVRRQRRLQPARRACRRDPGASGSPTPARWPACTRP
jgi:hypothetical protein